MQYELFDTISSLAPQRIITQKVGSDLLIYLFTCYVDSNLPPEPSIQIKNYYQTPNGIATENHLVGLNGNGQYYDYAPAVSETQYSSGNLVPQVLTNDSVIDSRLLWWGALALTPLGFLASRNHTNENHNGTISQEKSDTDSQPKDENHHNFQPKPESEESHKPQQNPKIEHPKEDTNVASSFSDNELLELYKPTFHYSHGRYYDQFEVFGSAVHNAQGKTTALNYELVEYDRGIDPLYPNNPDDHWYVRIDLDKNLVYTEVGAGRDSRVQVGYLISNTTNVYLDAMAISQQAWLNPNKVPNANSILKDYKLSYKDIRHHWDLNDVVDDSPLALRHSNYSASELTSYDTTIQPIPTFDFMI